MTKTNVKVRRDPVLSAWNAAQFVYAPQHRAYEIVSRSAISRTYQRTAYRGLPELMAIHLATAIEDRSLESLRIAVSSRCLDERTKSLQLSAVAALSQVWPTLVLTNGIRVLGTKNERLTYSPIDVVRTNASPSLLLLDPCRDIVVGAVQIVLSKSNALDADSGTLTAHIVRKALTQRYGAGANPSLVFVIDAFGGQIYTAPTKHARLDARLQQGMLALASHWNHVVARYERAA